MLGGISAYQIGFTTLGHIPIGKAMQQVSL